LTVAQLKQRLRSDVARTQIDNQIMREDFEMSVHSWQLC